MLTGRTLFTLLSAAAAAVLAILVLPGLNTTWETVFADLVVTNATIYTSDVSFPFAEAMAVRDGRILRAGKEDEMRSLVGRDTHELNLKGKFVVPGFIDSHVHLISGGLQMGRVNLFNVKSQSEFVGKVKAAVQDKDHGDWILGGGWNNDMWGGDLPAASWIDAITLKNPVWFSRMDGHMGLANSVALKIAGINNETKDPIGGTIMKSVDGEPTGLLVDAGMKLILDLIPEVSVHERRDALTRAGKHALMRGVTTVVDFGRYFPGAPVDHAWQDLSDVYQWADSSAKMLIRVCLFFPMQTWLDAVNLLEETGRTLSQWLYLGGVKAFSDGSLGSNSALFHEPYEDDPDNYGLQVTDFDWLLNATLASDRSGLQVAVHAIGDKANDMVLDLFNSVASINGIRDRRLRIEHAQHLVPGTVSAPWCSCNLEVLRRDSGESVERRRNLGCDGSLLLGSGDIRVCSRMPARCIVALMVWLSVLGVVWESWCPTARICGTLMQLGSGVCEGLGAAQLISGARPLFKLCCQNSSVMRWSLSSLFRLFAQGIVAVFCSSRILGSWESGELGDIIQPQWPCCLRVFVGAN